MLFSGGDALNKVVRQERPRRRVYSWGRSVGAVARRSLRRANKLICITSAVGLSHMMRRVKAHEKRFAF